MKISVIMPLFNAGKYLPEALDSVLGQTCRDFEVICIDDCSTDDTGRILAEYRDRDNRVRILTNETRLGAGPSRNKGIKEARGKYIQFLDGDDLFDEQLLEKASAAMERHGADIVLFEALYHVPSENIHTKKSIERSREFQKNYCSTPFFMDDFKPEESPNWSDVPWDKMFLRKLIMEHHLEFQDLPSSNDVYFAQMAMFCAQRIIWLNDSSVLVYAREHAEASRISTDRDPMCAYLALEKLVLELGKRDMLSRMAEYAYYTVQSKLFYLLSVQKNEECKKNFYQFLQDEGIDRLISHGGKFYSKADRYVRYLLEGFRDHPYERGWFQSPDSYFQCCLDRHGDSVCRFIKERLLQDKRIVLWGAGINGKILLDLLEKESVRITGVVDRDEMKQNTVMCGYEITKPESFWQETDYFLFTSERIYQEAVSTMDDDHAVLVDVLGLLGESGE